MGKLVYHYRVMAGIHPHRWRYACGADTAELGTDALGETNCRACRVAIDPDDAEWIAEVD